MLNKMCALRPAEEREDAHVALFVLGIKKIKAIFILLLFISRSFIPKGYVDHTHQGKACTVKQKKSSAPSVTLCASPGVWVLLNKRDQGKEKERKAISIKRQLKKSQSLPFPNKNQAAKKKPISAPPKQDSGGAFR